VRRQPRYAEAAPAALVRTKLRWYLARIAAYRTQQQRSRFDRVMQAIAGTRAGGWLFIDVFPVRVTESRRFSGRLSSLGLC
jgi:hypothetical protein